MNVVTNPVYYNKYPTAFGISLLPDSNLVKIIIPIVDKHDKNENKATIFFVSYLCVSNKLMIDAKISAIAVERDIKKRFKGKVSK